MGNITDKIKEMQDKNDTETKEKLQMVHNMMVDKITAASNKMGDEAGEDKNLPIVSVVDKSEKYQIKVESTPDKDIKNAIGEVMSGDFLGGLKNLLSVALNEVLGNTSAGEAEKTDFHVIYANNSLLRLDYMMYKYTFASKGLTHLEGLTVFAERLYSAVAKLKKAALTGGNPSDEGKKPGGDDKDVKPDANGSQEEEKQKGDGDST